MPSPPPRKRKCITPSSTAPERESSPPPLRRKPNPPIEEKRPRPEPEDRMRKNRGALETDRRRKTFAIISWNVNGIQHLLPKNRDQKSIKQFFRTHSPQGEDGSQNENPIRAFLRRHCWPAVLGLQEVKIPRGPEGDRLMTALESAANATGSGESKVERGRQYRAFFSLPRDKFNARGLGGKGKVHGVCSLIRSDISCISQTKDVDWDLEGRVLLTSLELGGEKVVVCNGYWPNGTPNPWRDSRSGEVRGTRHDFKRLFHSRMLGEVKSWDGKGYTVVLVGDMNVAPQESDGYPGIRNGVEHVRNRRDFNEKFLDAGNEIGMRGVDSWRWCRGDERGFSYHGEKEEEWGSSCDRVDLGIVSRSLVEGRGVRLKEAEIWESAEERGGSDHVPIGIVLELDDGFKAEGRTKVEPPLR